MNKICKSLVALCAVISIFGAVHGALADAALFLSPTRIALDDENKVAVINVTNMSEMAKAYTISLENLIMTPEGVTAQVDNFDYSAKRMLRFVPREFTLEPGERQSVRIMARVRPDTEDGDFHSHIHFLEDVSKSNALNKDRKVEGKGRIEVQFAYSAMVPIIVSHGEVDRSVGMEDPQVTWKDRESKLLNVTMQLTRAGNGQGTAYIDAHYVTADGKDKPLTSRKTVQIYREIDARKFNFDFVLPDDAPANGSIKISLFDDAEQKQDPISQATLQLPD